MPALLLSLLLLACSRTAAPGAGPGDNDSPSAETDDTAGPPADSGEPELPAATLVETALSGPSAGAMLGWRVAAGEGAVWASAPGLGEVYRFDAAALDGEAREAGAAAGLTLRSDGGGLFGYGLAVSGGLVAVGAPSEDASAGAVYLFGALGGGEVLHRIAGPDPGSSFGVHLAAGAAPLALLVAATDDDSGGVAGGAVYLLSLAEPAEPWVAAVHADTAGQQVGTGMAQADLDGDGVAELVIGCGGEGPGSIGEGDVAVFAGPVSGSRSLADADLRLRGAAPLEHLGNKVAAGEDLDGDGYGELAAAAYWGSARAERGGAVYVFRGPLAEVDGVEDAAATLWGGEPYGYGGIALEMVGDADGDGQAELLIGEYGARSRSGEGEVVGAARLFSGMPAGALALSEAAVTVWGAEPGGSFGYTLGGGDVDGSARHDLAISAYTAEEGTGILRVIPGEGLR